MGELEGCGAEDGGDQSDQVHLQVQARTQEDEQRVTVISSALNQHSLRDSYHQRWEVTMVLAYNQ